MRRLCPGFPCISILAVLTGKVRMLWVVPRLLKAHGCFSVTLADKHLTWIVVFFAGDSLRGSVTLVAIYFSVRVVKDAPAILMLHGIRVAVVMNLTASVQIIHRCA